MMVYLPALFILLVVILVIMLLILQSRVSILSAELKRSKANMEKFRALVSHQLRSPASGIKWAIETLSESTENMPDDQKDLIKKIDELNNTSIRLIKEIAEMARSEVGKIPGIVNSTVTDLSKFENRPK